MNDIGGDKLPKERCIVGIIRLLQSMAPGMQIQAYSLLERTNCLWFRCHRQTPPESFLTRFGQMNKLGERRCMRQETEMIGAPAAHIGRKLRHMRKRSELTLQEVARRAGCSESLVSKVETGKALPSLSNLHRIVSVLGGNISTLFQAVETRPEQVWKAGKRPIIATGSRRGNSVELEQLVADEPKRMLEANIHLIPPGGGSDGSLRHEGEEMGYVLAGQIELIIDGRKHQLAEGDSFAFRSELSHSYRNIGRKTARIMWINTPPTF